MAFSKCDHKLDAQSLWRWRGVVAAVRGLFQRAESHQHVLSVCNSGQVGRAVVVALARCDLRSVWANPSRQHAVIV